MKTKKQPFNAENLSLEKVEIREFSIKVADELSFAEDIILPASIELQTSSYSGLNLDDNLIAFGLKLNGTFDLDNQAENKSTFFIDLLFHFKHDHLSDYIKIDKKDNYTVDSLIGEVLAAVAYSTARGILIEKTARTPFNGFILPIIKPSDLLE